MTVTACPQRLAMSLETTTHVRVFRGSTPTEGSHWIHRMSPRRKSTGSRIFLVQQLELRRFELLEQGTGVLAVRRVGGRQSLSKAQPVATVQPLTQDLP